MHFRDYYFFFSHSSGVCFAQPLKRVGVPSGSGIAAQNYGLSETMKIEGARGVHVTERSKRVQEAVSELDDYQRCDDRVRREVTADKQKLDLEFEVRITF